MSMYREIVDEQIRQLHAQEAEMLREAALGDQGELAGTNGKVHPKAKQKILADQARAQAAVYADMIKALKSLIAGKVEHMDEATKKAARKGIEIARERGYGDDSTVDHLATHLALYTKVGGEAAARLAYDIVHKLKCKV